jgi:hypothetical protein
MRACVVFALYGMLMCGMCDRMVAFSYTFVFLHVYVRACVRVYTWIWDCTRPHNLSMCVCVCVCVCLHVALVHLFIQKCACTRDGREECIKSAENMITLNQNKI